MTKEQIKMKITAIINHLSELDKNAMERYEFLKKRFNLKNTSEYAYKYGYIAEGVNITIQDLELLLKVI